MANYFRGFLREKKKKEVGKHWDKQTDQMWFAVAVVQ
jgi:hypothetical protein